MKTIHELKLENIEHYKKFIKNVEKKASMDKTELIVWEVAFDKEYQGYRFKATYLNKPKGDALIEITKDGDIVREFLFPSYKIWNIAAHIPDIILSLEQDSDNGSFGLDGNVYIC